MRIETPRPSPREDGDYGVWVTMGYGDPEATIHLAENGTLDLRDIRAGDCDRLIRAAAKAKDEILRYQAMMAAPHGSRYFYHGTCQLCGKPADDPGALHGELPAAAPEGLEDAAAQDENEAGDPFMKATPMQDPAPVVRVIGEDGPLCATAGCAHPERGHVFGLQPSIPSGACGTCSCRAWQQPERSGFIAADSPVLRGARIGGGQ